MPLATNMSEFWICQCYEYTRVLNMPLVLNMAGFWICQVCTGSWICLNNSWICLIMPEYVWICLIIPEYAKICVNIPKSASIVFVLHVPIVIPYLLECMITYLSEVYSLKEHEAVLLKRQNFNYPLVAGSIWFVICVKLNTFTSKILSMLLPIGQERARGLQILICYYIVVKE